MIIPSVQNIIAGASNIREGKNPPFSVEDFKKDYPQFWADGVKELLPDGVIKMYLGLALAIVNIARYHEAWRVCVGLVTAHFLILYLRTRSLNPDPTAADIIKAGETRGLVASKSVDGVSVSYDYSAAVSDIDGWGAWKTTEYGTQFLVFVRVYNLGGMRVW